MPPPEGLRLSRVMPLPEYEASRRGSRTGQSDRTEGDSDYESESDHRDFGSDDIAHSQEEQQALAAAAGGGYTAEEFKRMQENG